MYVRAFLSLCPQRPFSLPFPFASVFPVKETIYTYFDIVIVQATRERFGSNPSSPRSVSLLFLPDPHLSLLPSLTQALPPISCRLSPAAHRARPSRAPKSLGSCERARGPAPSRCLFHHCRNSISPFEGVYAERGRPSGCTTRAASVRRLPRENGPCPAAPGVGLRPPGTHREFSKRRGGGSERGDDRASAASRSRAPCVPARVACGPRTPWPARSRI